MVTLRDLQQDCVKSTFAYAINFYITNVILLTFYYAQGRKIKTPLRFDIQKRNSGPCIIIIVMVVAFFDMDFVLPPITSQNRVTKILDLSAIAGLSFILLPLLM